MKNVMWILLSMFITVDKRWYPKVDKICDYKQMKGF